MGWDYQLTCKPSRHYRRKIADKPGIIQLKKAVFFTLAEAQDIAVVFVDNENCHDQGAIDNFPAIAELIDKERHGGGGHQGT